MPRSSLIALSRSLKQYFETFHVEAEVHLGLKARNNWDSSRVVLIDGEFDGSNDPKPMSAGEFLAPTQKQSINPRELAAWARPLTASIRAVDPGNPDDEESQIAATENLIEHTVQGLHNAYDVDDGTGLGQANIEWGKATWIYPPVEQPWGKEFLITFTHHEVIFDRAWPSVLRPGVLQKGPLLNTPKSGVNAFVFAKTGTTVTISGLAFCNPSEVGQTITLSGCASSANNGAFVITTVNSSQSVTITNASGVAPDANNGSIAWAITP